MSTEARIIAFNRAHPEWNDEQLARAACCSKRYANSVCNKHGLIRPSCQERASALGRIVVMPDEGMREWLVDVAKRMGPGVMPRDVVKAILRDARAGD